MEVVMKLLGDIAIIIGIILSFLGILGGLFTLPLSIKKLRKELSPYGNKGTGFCVIKREDLTDNIIITFLIVEDLFHFIKSFVNNEFKGTVKSIESVGEYFTVVIYFPPDANLTYIKTTK